MMCTMKTVNRKDIRSAISGYAAVVKPDLNQLDRLRYINIPWRLAARRAEANFFFEKASLDRLMEWKLYDFTRFSTRISSIHGFKRF